MQVRLCNLDFGPVVPFVPFSVAGYRFEPISGAQPRRPRTYDDKYRAGYHRHTVPNARAIFSTPEIPSVIFRDTLRSRTRKRTLLDDLLALISILTGRNVRRWSERCARDFPVTASSQIEATATEPYELSRHLELGVSALLDAGWQQKFHDGFQLIELLSLSNILNSEFRFAAYSAIWQYVYYCEHKDVLRADQLQDVKLKDSVYWLLRKYHLAKGRKYRRGVTHCQEAFSELRNQVAHGGRFRRDELGGALHNASPQLCYKYMRLFERLTESLVLASIGIERGAHLWALEELLVKGSVKSYEQEVEVGW